MKFPAASTVSAFVSPMLAFRGQPDWSKVAYPKAGTPKLDGIRCLTLPPVRKGDKCSAVSKQFKPIRNTHVRRQIEMTCPPGLDGELDLRKKKGFDDVNSAFMREGRCPAGWYYAVFDCLSVGGASASYRERLRQLSETVLPDFCKKLLPVKLSTAKEVKRYILECLQEGYEGAIVRCYRAPYKFGRSTLREGWMLKAKLFEDAEARIIGFEELMHNDNAAKRNAQGHLERSSHKANKRGGDTLGKLLCVTPAGVVFKIGTGYSKLKRKEIWNNRADWLGNFVKYRHQPFGKKDKPRFPVYLGRRSSEDII